MSPTTTASGTTGASATTGWPASVVGMTTQELDASVIASVDLNARDRRGRTPILLAAQAGRLDLVAALAASGADIDLQDRTRLNPFLWGCIVGDLDLIRLMLDLGADLDRTTRMGGVGIHPAAEKGHVGATRLLATTDVNVDHTNNLGWTPLLEAVMLRDGGPDQQEIVRILLEAGADASLTDPYGVTPLGHADRLGFVEIAALLRQHQD